MALFKQPQYSPYPVNEMTVSLWLGTTGRLDKVPTDDVLRFERSSSTSCVARTRGPRHDRGDEQVRRRQRAGARGAYNEFLDQFETSEASSIKAGHEELEALPEDELEQEQIVKQKRG